MSRKNQISAGEEASRTGTSWGLEVADIRHDHCGHTRHNWVLIAPLVSLLNCLAKGLPTAHNGLLVLRKGYPKTLVFLLYFRPILYHAASIPKGLFPSEKPMQLKQKHFSYSSI